VYTLEVTLITVICLGVIIVDIWRTGVKQLSAVECSLFRNVKISKSSQNQIGPENF